MAGDTSAAQQNPAGVRKRRPLRAAAAGTLIAILAVLVLAADQSSKQLVLASFEVEKPVPILGDFLVFYLTFNPGAAFSLGEEVTWVFTIALAVVAAVIVWLAATRIRTRSWAIVLGLLLGGVLGNLTDRLFRDPGFPVGHVVDFIHTPWMMPAIYNVADIFIVCDMILVALLVLLGIRFDGTRERDVAAAESAAAEADATVDVDAAANDAEVDAATEAPTADSAIDPPAGRADDVRGPATS